MTTMTRRRLSGSIGSRSPLMESACNRWHRLAEMTTLPVRLKLQPEGRRTRLDVADLID